MRTYNMLKLRAQQFDADPQVRAWIAERKDAHMDPLLAGPYSKARAQALRAAQMDVAAIGAEGLHYERLDQRMLEHMLGVRS
jgi:xylose isomerase